VVQVRSRYLFFFSVAVLILVGVSGPWAQPITKDACLACHSAELEKKRDGKTVSLQVEKETFDRSIHGVFECAACHTDVSEIPHKAELKPVECQNCHADSVKAYSESIHGKARAQGFTEPPTCTSCHGDIHKLVRRSDPSSPVNPQNIAATCAVCHADTALAKKFRIPVVRPVEAYLKSIHARAVAAGKAGAVCTNCHGAHNIVPGGDPSSQIFRTNVPQTCGQCHANVLAAYRQSIHGEAVAGGVRDAPVCTDCHGEHRILARNEPNSPVFTSNVAGETCGRCHADARMSEKFGIAPDKVPAFQDSFHGLGFARRPVDGCQLRKLSRRARHSAVVGSALPCSSRQSAGNVRQVPPRRGHALRAGADTHSAGICKFPGVVLDSYHLSLDHHGDDRIYDRAQRA
jgi:hypothetical protein